ncbi:hypothetical protein [Aquihabitans sp. McL0605]|uniref:hypothetical protein n=1 Tax=Aquihabitans sp. McL0605 TaxID=3415671 RepID=UPI003CF812D6
MTSTLSTTSGTVSDAEGTDPEATTTTPPPRQGRPRWPIFGVVGAVAGFAAVGVSMSPMTEDDAAKGVGIVDDLHRGGYHAGFLLGLVSVACLLVASSGWRRWAERTAPDDLAARTVGQGLAATATVNIIFFCLMGSMADYLPGGADHGWLSDQAVFTNFTLLDFGALLGWWGAAVSAVCVAALAFGRQRALPRWMGIVSAVLLLPAAAFAIATGLPGFVGVVMPVWLVVISLGMVFSRTANTQP